MLTLIPTDQPDSQDTLVKNDGWYPDLDAKDFIDQTGQPDIFDMVRVTSALQAVIEINLSLADWRDRQTVDSLSAVPATNYGGVSEKVILYTTAVFSRVRAQLLRKTRDFDSTKDGHNRADKLEETATDYLRQSTEALARLTGRSRTVVELI